MRTKVKTRSSKTVVPAKVELEKVQSPLVKLIADSSVPEHLAAILEGWKTIGNKWLTCTEAELELQNRGLEVEGFIPINAVRALVYLGFMVLNKEGFNELWTTRYRLSEAGLKAVAGKYVPPTLPEKGNAEPILEVIECDVCEGTGVDDNFEECQWCKGTGELSKDRADNIRMLLNKPAKTETKRRVRRK